MSKLNTQILASVKGVLLLLCGLFFFKALFLYEGSKGVYLLFSISYFTLLLYALKTRKTYGYLFLAIFLWLGFWLKFTWHTVFNYDYIEPIGLFVFSATSLDKVLIIASIGCWGVILAGLLLSFAKWQSTVYALSPTKQRIPAFYVKYRTMMMTALILLIIGVSLLNALMGVGMSGIVPQVTLIWPLNALIYWALAIGFALMMATFLWWEILLDKKASNVFIAALSEPFCTSISILSRASYIFHVIPIAVSFLFNKEVLQVKCKKWSFIMTLVLSAVLFVLSLQCVSWLRNYYYSGISVSQSISSSKGSSLINATSSLIVDRWLGVEGLMVISSYPHKNIGLLKEATLEKAELGKVGMYQKIANSHYVNMDTSRFMFATIPGPIAFFYYSGSLVVVFMGMLLFTLLLLLSEHVVVYLVKNVFLSALYGMYVANAVAQFGLTPHLLPKQFFLIFAYLLMVFFVQEYSNSKRSKIQCI